MNRQAAIQGKSGSAPRAPPSLASPLDDAELDEPMEIVFAEESKIADQDKPRRSSDSSRGKKKRPPRQKKSKRLSSKVSGKPKT